MTSSLSDGAAEVDLAAVSYRLYLGCREIQPDSCVERRRGNKARIKRRRGCDRRTAGVDSVRGELLFWFKCSVALNAAADWN